MLPRLASKVYWRKSSWSSTVDPSRGMASMSLAQWCSTVLRSSVASLVREKTGWRRFCVHVGMVG